MLAGEQSRPLRVRTLRILGGGLIVGRLSSPAARAASVEISMYRLSLKSDRHNPAATAGAGLAVFELGRYALVQCYLQAAVSANFSDAQSAVRLKATEFILQMDPFRRQSSVAPRKGKVILKRNLSFMGLLAFILLVSGYAQHLQDGPNQEAIRPNVPPLLQNKAVYDKRGTIDPEGEVYVSHKLLPVMVVTTPQCPFVDVPNHPEEIKTSDKFNCDPLAFVQRAVKVEGGRLDRRPKTVTFPYRLTFWHKHPVFCVPFDDQSQKLKPGTGEACYFRDIERLHVAIP